MIAHVLVSKFADHLPLYRQAQIYARSGIELHRSTLADWVGKASFHLRPVYECLKAELKTSNNLGLDETTVRVLDPGRGKTKTGYMWTMARDERGWSGPDPPGCVYEYVPSRSGKHGEKLLEGFEGTVQVDGYPGHNRLRREDRPGGPLTLAAFRVGGVVAEPLPSQTRTSRFPASGSSHASFAYGGVQLMNEPGRRQRVPGEDCLHLVPGEPPFLAAARQPPLPGQDDALSEPPNAFAVACQTVVGVVPTEHARETSVLVREPPVAVSLAPLPRPFATHGHSGPLP